VTARTDQIDALLRQEIADLVTREVADPRIGFATITDVETTSDLRHAQVWVSVIGQPAERETTVAALGRAMPFIRHELGRRLRLRRIPELHVRLDDTAERGTRVLRLLNELEAGVEVEPDLPAGESLPTPVARLPHEGDVVEEPAPAVPQPPAQPRPARRRGNGPRRDAGPPRGAGRRPRR
jgi:ribosome-binding factor A